MKFKEWYYLEMGGIRTMDTSGINLHTEREPFDSYEARHECQQLAKQQEFYKGIYDSPEQDPNYKYGDDNNAWWDERDQKLKAIYDDYNKFVIQCVEQKRQEYGTTGKVSGYYRSWNIDGDNYVAHFSRKATPAAIKNMVGEIPDIYSITFEGPEGYDLTKKAGAKATTIYTQLLAAAKKVMETTNVNGWYFSPADDKMALMYRKFFEDYLQKDFIQPMKYFYLRKDVLKQKLAQVSPEMRQQLYAKMLGSNREMRSERQIINQKKINQRNAYISARQYIGKIVGYKTGYAMGVLPAYVKSVTPDGAELYMVDTYDGRNLHKRKWPLVVDDMSATAFTDLSSVDPGKLAKLQELLKQKAVV